MSMKAKPAMRAVTAETVGSGDLMIMRCNDVLKRKYLQIHTKLSS